jgi:hypothetical protein
MRNLGVTIGQLIVACVVVAGNCRAVPIEGLQIPNPTSMLSGNASASAGNFNPLRAHETPALRSLWRNPFIRPGEKDSNTGPAPMPESPPVLSLPLLEEQLSDGEFSASWMPRGGTWALNSQNETPPKKKPNPRSPSAASGSPGHIFWVVPAYKVDYSRNFKPLTPREKFNEWAQDTYDPLGLGVGAFEAGTLEYSSSDGFCGYGHGWANYGKCFGSLELDAVDSGFIGDFVLPVLWHQDPRYFRLGKGSFGRRTWYAITRVFVTVNDSGHPVFYSSALSGTVIAAALSNLYYPQQDVGFGHTMSRIGIDLGNTALYNLSAEFWPDIDHGLKQVF